MRDLLGQPDVLDVRVLLRALSFPVFAQ